MNVFLIQTKDDKVLHDFSFHLLEAIEFQNWFRDAKLHDCIHVNDHHFEFSFSSPPIEPNYVPIGSVEYVLNFYKKFYDIDIKPINIPEELMKHKFLKRNVFVGDETTKLDNPLFVKSADKIKGFVDIILPTDHKILTKGKYLFSEVVSIDSEWRGFVFNNELLDLRCYLGNFALYPQVNLVKKMIETYVNSPRAYTIDVGVSKELRTFLIEIHQFFSCGLYGFTHYNVLPQMFVSCHKEIIKRESINGY